MTSYPQNEGPLSDWHKGEIDPGFYVAKITQTDASSQTVHVGYFAVVRLGKNSGPPQTVEHHWILFGDKNPPSGSYSLNGATAGWYSKLEHPGSPEGPEMPITLAKLDVPPGQGNVASYFSTWLQNNLPTDSQTNKTIPYAHQQCAMTAASWQQVP